MLDLNTPSGRIMKAALDLAAAKRWSEVTLAEIAEATGVSLVDVRAHFASKSDILARLLRTIDDAVLRTARPPAGLGKRDALFEVVMSRFDTLAPHKAALRSIHASGAADFSLAAPYLASQHWMLQAAGIGTDGISGGARVAGLALAYARVFRIWLHDDDPGLGKTMAALDRALRRGESMLSGFHNAGRTLDRFGKVARDMARAACQARAPAPSPEAATPQPPPGAPPSPEAGKS